MAPRTHFTYGWQLLIKDCKRYDNQPNFSSPLLNSNTYPTLIYVENTQRNMSSFPVKCPLSISSIVSKFEYNPHYQTSRKFFIGSRDVTVRSHKCRLLPASICSGLPNYDAVYFNVSKKTAASTFKAEVFFKIAAVFYPKLLYSCTILHGVMKS